MPAKRIVAVTLCVAGFLLPPAVASTSAPPQTRLRVSASAGQAGESRTIEVIARRYSFEPAVIEAVEGERLRILVKSGDGLHGFEIKKFKVSKEIPRGGDAVVIEFTASEAGKFPILCSVFCGDGHGDMKGTLIVSASDVATP